jgi:CRP/FNR family transcriptional regulator, cyclic AMP receptor protein
MDKPKIFIASSSRAKQLAEVLASYLEEKKVVSVQRWYKKTFLPGASTLDSLRNQAKECDFIAVLLTEDDVLNKGGQKVRSPRDNCIFELGLFMGALDLDPGRCFMLTSADEKALPSDLKGRTYIPLEKLTATQLSDTGRCLAAIKKNFQRPHGCFTWQADTERNQRPGTFQTA